MTKLLFVFFALSFLAFPASAQEARSDALDTSTYKAKFLRYWFDADASSVMTEDLSLGVHFIDASALSNGLHTLHYQAVAEDGGLLGVNSFTFLAEMCRKDNAIGAKSLRYWFDDNASEMKTENIGMGIHPIDAAGLSNNLHTLHYQIVAEDGNAAGTHSVLFLADMHEVGFAKSLLRYWFDDDASSVMTEVLGMGIHTIDASALSNGLHTLHYQAVGEDGSLQRVQSATFLVEMCSKSNVIAAKSLRYWFDDNASEMKKEDIGMDFHVIDASGLSNGLHALHYQIVTEEGNTAGTQTALFLADKHEDSFAKSLRYWFDDDANSVVTEDLSKGLHAVDASGLSNGLHSLHYQIIGKDGLVYEVQSKAFLMLSEPAALGLNRISRYEYWINDCYADKKKFEVSNPNKEYLLTSLLPVESQPLRSSSFALEVKSGVPTMYAKNDIHMRFFDTFGYWSDEARSFVDKSVSREVGGVTPLNQTQTFERVPANEVKWFSFYSEEGDTIALKASQATSIQVFDPEGKEIYAASGSQSVASGGCHTWADGTYYVAVHDVTGSKADITLDYFHMDRYDVVGQDVRVVGNGGCSTITFQGNGFKDLYAVDLYTAQGDTIHSVDIGHESDACTTVTFDFTFAGLGMYDALFHFTEEDKTLSGNIFVEEAEDVELIANVICPSVYLKSNTTTFTFVIENKGNSTAYRVPLHIQLFAEGGCKDITYAKFSENIPMPNMNWLDPEIYPSETVDSIAAFVAKNGDLLRFINVMDSTSGETFKDSYLAINVAPKSSFTFTITLKSNSSVKALVSMPTDWYFVSLVETEKDNHARRVAEGRSVKENMCCVREHVECFMNVLVSALDFMSIFGANWSVADCIGALANEGLSFAYDVWCGELHGGKNAGKAAEDLRMTAINTLLSCLPPGADKYNLVWIYEHIYDVIKVTYDCVQALNHANNCPQESPLQVGPSSPVESFDPNDIHGYIAQSGCRFVGKDIATLPYRIEFENDTAFATAPAHTVIVTDTLDATKFDLASYLPTSIKIGDKEVHLKGDKTFVTTVDMRPEIHAIAQVEGAYDEKTGVAKWKFTSLDPMTMEETDDVMQGFLPVNYDGSGIGEVAFHVNRLPDLMEGTEILNRASIIFDTNEPILTPTWTNTLDVIAPVSSVTNVELSTDSVFTIHFDGEDNRSGIWKYDVYYRWKTDMDWICIARDCDSTAFDKTAVAGYTYQFCVLATDSAGNVEQKELTPEFEFYTGMLGDVDRDGFVTANDVYGAVGLILEEPGSEAMDVVAADVNRDGCISVADASGIVSIILDQPLVSKTRRVVAMRGNDNLDIAPIAMDYDETLAIPVSTVNGNSSYVAMQFDLTLPQGVELAEVKGTNEHFCKMATLASGKKRVVCLSQRNETMTAQSLILELKSSGKAVAGTIDIGGIELVGAKMRASHPEDICVPVRVGDATSIDMVDGDGRNGSTYDLNGRKVKEMQKGVYIQNGKSVYIDK